MSKTELKTRVRYSRLGADDRTPKNTLVTVSNGNKVYFGIARCNIKLDKFHKNIGTNIATGRAKSVVNDSSSNYNTYELTKKSKFYLHKSGLCGSVSLKNIKDVVEYFRHIDEYSLVVLTPRTVGV